MPLSESCPNQGAVNSERVNHLPRYSAISWLRPSGSHSTDVNDVAGGADPLSAASPASSQLTLPAYTAFVDLLHRLSFISPSMTTLSRPPRYTSAITLVDDGNAPPQTVALNSEHTFTISSSFKNKPWATLRLYDGHPPSPRASTKGRHPRFSNVDKIIGNVELSLTSPQTIKTIELVLKGTMIAGGSGDGGLTVFLDHRYTLWDRKFGDPRYLASGRPSNAKYDGKLSGNWIFPFAIPFPSHVDLATRCAVHATGSEGPVRFLPEQQSPTLIPFQLGESPGNVQDSVYGEPGGSDTITPFNTTARCRVLTVKGKRHPELNPSSVPDGPLADSVTVVPISTQVERPPNMPAVAPLLRPYAGSPHERTGSGSTFHSDEHPAKGQRSRRVAGRSVHDRTGTCYLGTAPISEPEIPFLPNSHPLPQSFLEKEVMANIHYELGLVVTHGRLATTGSRVQSTILYRPVTTPPSMSLKRQLSLRQRAPPRSPNLDPGIWKRLPAAWMRGIYLDQQSVAVQCTLHIALPLSYARGTLIPCALTLVSENPAALNFFTNPRTAPLVQLKRLASFSQNQDATSSASISTATSLGFHAGRLAYSDSIYPITPKIFNGPSELIKRSTPRASMRSSSSSNFVAPFTPDTYDVDGEDLLWSDDAPYKQVIGDNAVWCTPENYAQEPQVKRLYGEIYLPKGLEATCRFPLFKILYRVELLAPNSGAFVPDATPSDGPDVEHVYASQVVEIVTGVRKDEPVPVRLIGASTRPAPPANNTRPNGPQDVAGALASAST